MKNFTLEILFVLFLLCYFDRWSSPVDPQCLTLYWFFNNTLLIQRCQKIMFVLSENRAIFQRIIYLELCSQTFPCFANFYLSSSLDEKLNSPLIHSSFLKLNCSKYLLAIFMTHQLNKLRIWIWIEKCLTFKSLFINFTINISTIMDLYGFLTELMRIWTIWLAIWILFASVWKLL